MKKRTKLHIVGTNGVPANYGGFETLTDYLCQHLNSDFDITVYCSSSKYDVKNESYHGAKLKYVNIRANGLMGLLYDCLTIMIAFFKSDAILYLGPGAGFITFLNLIFKKNLIVNHGGLNEWEREKLNAIQSIWVKLNHRIAAKFATVNIADNNRYCASLKNEFGTDSVVIRYGGDHAKKVAINDFRFKDKYDFVTEPYAVSVSRAQVDNNLHIVLEAFEEVSEMKLVMVANWNISKYGKDLKAKYLNHPNMILIDAVYNKEELNYIRGNASIYIHSHSRCGTAPSLVEAMSLGNAIIAYDVDTNRETTNNKALYFKCSATLRNKLKNISQEDYLSLGQEMDNIATSNYSWCKIARQYKDTILNNC